MSLSNYLFCIKKRLFAKRWLLYLNICVSALALSLLCAAVVIPQILNHSEDTIKQALAEDMSKFGVIRNGGKDLYDKNISAYISDIYNAPEIDGVGAWTYGGFGYKATVNYETDYWNQILEIQNAHIREFDESPSEVQLVYMPAYAFRINHLELYSGSDAQVGTNTEYLMYLGYNFKDIPIGTVFEDEKYGTSYTVSGILQKNSSVVDAQRILWNIQGVPLSCCVAMDNMVLLIAPYNGENYIYPVYFFKCAKGYDYEEAAAKIEEISDKYGIQTATGTLSKRVNDVLSDINWLLDGITELSTVLLPAAFIMLLTTQLLTIIFRRDELGVWLVSGMGRKGIFHILLGENMVKMIISACISYGVILVCAKIGYSSTNIAASVAYGLRYIFWIELPIFLLLCAVIMSVLCSAISITYVGKKSIPDIIRGTWR